MADIYISKQKTEKSMEKKKTVGKVNPMPSGRTSGKKEESTHQQTLKELLPESTTNPLAAFSCYPTGATFAGADSQEKIILVLRKHPITNVGWTILSAIMLLAPLVFLLTPISAAIATNYLIVGVMFWYLITTAFIFEEFLSWYFNVNIVTDERIFDVDFYNLVYREITDANLDQIQDVTVRVGSALRTVLNYGDVIVQTAAEIPQIEFHGVPQPDRVAKVLRELRVQEEVEKLEGRVR